MLLFLQSCLQWPILPATVLLLLICLYWVLMLLGAVDLDFLDLDIDLDLDADADLSVDMNSAAPSVLQFGMVPLNWLNIGSVPTMLWGSIFALTGFVVSRLWNADVLHESFLWPADVLRVLRDFGVAALITKGMTQPLRGKFDHEEPNRADQIVGRTCTVLTSEVNRVFGEAELATDGAPLRLKVRNDKGDLSRGDRALITFYREEENVYVVERM